MGHGNPKFPDKPQGRLRFFQKWVWGQMFSAKSWTQDKKARSLQWPRKVYFFKTPFGTGAFFSEVGVRTHVFGQVLDTRPTKRDPCRCLRKTNCSRRPSRPTLAFLEWPFWCWLMGRRAVLDETNKFIYGCVGVRICKDGFLDQWPIFQSVSGGAPLCFVLLLQMDFLYDIFCGCFGGHPRG